VTQVPAIVQPIASSAAQVAPRLKSSQAIGLTLAVVAGVHQAVIASAPTNDDFLHLVTANQILAGDWPYRDFFELYGPLMYGLSALSRLMFGHRLLSEAVVVGSALAVSTYLVFKLVRSLTGSSAAAVLSALLLMVAGVRGYSYPKVLLYAVAATMWWAYVKEPTRLKALALGAWVAAAFYWRADHGVYVAAGVALAMVCAHGVSRLATIRLAQAGAVSLLAVSPFLILALSTVGLRSYITDGAAIVNTQHTETSSHTWPKWPIRGVSDVIRLDGPEEFAPVVRLRWTEDSSAEARSAVLAKYRLTPVSDDGPQVQVVRMSEQSSGAVRGLINEPIVADTSGIDRSQSKLPWSTFPLWQRLRFSHWWLRFRVFTGVNEHGNAGQAVAAIFYTLPLIVILAAVPWLHRYLRPRATPARLVAFGLFGVVTAFGLMRSPYEVRAVDDVTIPAILFGCCVAALWRTAFARRGVLRVVLAVAAVVLVVLVVKSVAVAGEFPSRVAWLTGEGRSLERMRGAWREVHDRLIAGPPLTYWNGMPKSAELQLSEYAAKCLPSSQRLLVLWFAPEIYYYSDRLMAARHTFYDSGYQNIGQEQQLTLAKIRRYAPPFVYATGEIDSYTRSLYPEIVDYVHREYEAIGALEDDGRRYQLFLRKGASVVRSYGEHEWPCLT
jgi:4-amino-4-deoxy-L-arabinose transferase-like glycosyltransferase